MKRIDDLPRKKAYEKKCPLPDIFSVDISPHILVICFESGEPIMKENEASPYLYYLADGRAKLFLSHDNGRISLINFLDAPCFIGEIELIGAQNTANGVTAITACTCYAIPLRECKEKLLQDVSFLRYLCLSLGQKAIHNTANYTHNQSYPLEIRFADFILKAANKNIYREKHTEVSEFLGVTYRHLLYVLAGFVKKGILEKQTQGYLILDMDALLQIAKQST